MGRISDVKGRFMDRTHRPFPLVADNEPVIVPDRQMNLYDEGDLINNIHGTYQEKTYDQEKSPISVTSPVKALPKKEPDSLAAKARKEAKKDLKAKRQAMLDTDPKPAFTIKTRQAATPKKPAGNDLSRLGQKLAQETYILAELPPRYTQPQNESQTKPKKNNYDFLKRSQIYNKKELQSQKERRMAQELNLTRFED